MESALKSLLLAGIVVLVAGYPGNVPNSACKTMTPGHGGKALSTPAACTVKVVKESIKSGAALSVTVEATKGSSFRGYYVQARDKDGSPVGTFTPTDITKTNDCGGMKANGAHHANGKPKTAVPLIWRAPSNYKGTVVFTATCVKDFSNYWVGIKSPEVKIGEAQTLTDSS